MVEKNQGHNFLDSPRLTATATDNSPRLPHIHTRTYTNTTLTLAPPLVGHRLSKAYNIDNFFF